MLLMDFDDDIIEIQQSTVNKLEDGLGDQHVGPWGDANLYAGKTYTCYQIRRVLGNGRYSISMQGPFCLL
jgi:hypothetical protein